MKRLLFSPIVFFFNVLHAVLSMLSALLSALTDVVDDALAVVWDYQEEVKNLRDRKWHRKKK